MVVNMNRRSFNIRAVLVDSRFFRDKMIRTSSVLTHYLLKTQPRNG